MPTESATYNFVGDWLVRLAIPLLLFRANIREIIRTGGRLFVVFHISAVGTIIGTALAVWMLQTQIGSPTTEQAAGMLVGSNGLLAIGRGLGLCSAPLSLRG